MGNSIRQRIRVTFATVMISLLVLLSAVIIPERFIKEQDVRKDRISMLACLLGEDEGVKEAIYSGAADEHLIGLMDSLLEQYDVDFIVLAQLDGRRVYHPEHERIGEYFVGGDDQRIRDGEQAYISIATGTANKQQRAFYSVYREDECIGFVMVSLSMASIHGEQLRQIAQLVMVFVITMAVGLLAFEYVSNSMQEVLFGYEPEEFADIYRQAEQTLRASTHEFQNKLHVVAGLIQMNSADEALRYIGIITHELDEDQNTILKNILNPTIAALLLGKVSRAKELDIQFSLRLDSCLQRHSPYLSTNDMVTIIGNLTENAFDAVKNCQGTRDVEIFIGESADGLSISVDDTGEGMTEKQIEILRKKVYTTKGKGHGTGLRLIRGIVKRRHGYLEIESEPGEGSSFTVSFDKVRREYIDQNRDRGR